jgi:hypothetical protein
MGRVASCGVGVEETRLVQGMVGLAGMSVSILVCMGIDLGEVT